MFHTKYHNFHVKNLPLVYTLEDKCEGTLYDYLGIESLNPNYVISRQCTYIIYLETFYNPWSAFMIPLSACRDLQTHEEVILSWVQTGTGISNHINTHRDKKTRCSHNTCTWGPSFLKKVGLWETYLPVPLLFLGPRSDGDGPKWSQSWEMEKLVTPSCHTLNIPLYWNL